MTEGIFFTSSEHKQRFLGAMQQRGKISDGKLDPEYASALYILTSDLATWHKAQPYVDRHGLDIPTLLEEVDFSSDYRVLMRWACNLFNSYLHIDPIELLWLGERNFEVAISALRIRCSVLRVQDCQRAPTHIAATMRKREQ